MKRILAVLAVAIVVVGILSAWIPGEPTVAWAQNTPSASTCGTPQQTYYAYNNHFYLCNNGSPLQVDGGSGDTITSPNSTLTVGGTATATTLDLNLATANAWTAAQSISQATAGTASLSATNTADAGSVESIYALCSGITNGHLCELNFGRNIASNNVAELRFNYVSSGSASNNVSLGVWGSAGIAVDANGYVTSGIIIPKTLYSAAGTAIPSCTTALNGAIAVVSDATSPTYRGTYTSGGTVTTMVECNGGTTAWLTH